MKTIQVTDELAELLSKVGMTMIEIEQLKPKQWEPSETGWYINGYNNIAKSNLTSPMIIAVGATRKTEEQSILMKDRRLRSEKLSAFLAEIGEEKEWVKGEANWYIREEVGGWIVNPSYEYYQPEIVYMTKPGAEQACEALNSGYLKL